ncbi:MAG: hypothetical protein FJ302_13035 [Planctomycetes bacterium]|nr:hypothetical protein [Planctomycetota bacterium]
MAEIQTLSYKDLASDRQTVAAVQTLKAILAHASKGEPDCIMRVNDSKGGLGLYRVSKPKLDVLYAAKA